MPLLLEAPRCARPAPGRRQARLGALAFVMFLAALLGVHLPAANELNWYHDTVGNLTANFTYDGWGRLIGLGAHLTGETGGYDVISQSMRDYQGRTVAREEPQYNPPGTVGNVTQLLDTVYLYDGGSPVRRQLQAYDPAGLAEPIGSPSNLTYLRGPDQGGGVGGILYSVHPSGNTTAPYYFGYDGRGDVVAQTDANGNLTYQAAYNAYGQHSAGGGANLDTRAAGTNADPFQANTKEEEQYGLLNEGQRYRDLTTNVFLTRDPAGMVNGPNEYTYVMQNPWTKFDPLGLAGETAEELNDGHLTWGEVFHSFGQGWMQGGQNIANVFMTPVADANQLNQNMQAAPTVGQMTNNPEAYAAAKKQLVQSSLVPAARLPSNVPVTTLNPVMSGENPQNAVVENMPGAVTKQTEKNIAVATVANAAAKDAGAVSPTQTAQKTVAQTLLTVSKNANPWTGPVTSSVTQDTETMYRVWGGDASEQGAWLTRTKPTSAEQARAQLALPPENTAEYVSTVTVPKGTRVQSGAAAAAFKQPGGGQQVQLLDKIPASSYGQAEQLPTKQP